MPVQNLTLVSLRLKKVLTNELATDRSSTHRFFDRALKRGFDSAVALSCLFLLLPLFSLVALAVGSLNRESPFSSHRRIDRGGRGFGRLKIAHHAC